MWAIGWGQIKTQTRLPDHGNDLLAYRSILLLGRKRYCCVVYGINMHRRRLLLCAGALVAGSIAGCTDDSRDTDDSPQGYHGEFTEN